MKKRIALQALATMALGTTMFTVQAQDATFPSKTIRILAASAPGGLIDVASRVYAEKMSVYLKQPVIVENVVGAGGLLAIRQTMKSPADGYTLIVMANHLVWMPYTNSNAGYTLKDFSAIGEMVRAPSLLLTSGNSPYKNLSELIAAAKKNPGQISYGSGGIGTTNHLSGELLAWQSGVKFTHVPYKGITPAIPDVVAGRVSFFMPTASSVAELMKKGDLRPLGITSEKRSATFPDIPTLAELGYPSFDTWIGLLAPAGIPPVVRKRLGDAMEAARNDADVMRRFSTGGQEISAIRTPEQFDAALRADDQKFSKLIKEANIVGE